LRRSSPPSELINHALLAEQMLEAMRETFRWISSISAT
jgi:hypothetical protein